MVKVGEDLCIAGWEEVARLAGGAPAKSAIDGAVLARYRDLHRTAGAPFWQR